MIEREDMIKYAAEFVHDARGCDDCCQENFLDCPRFLAVELSRVARLNIERVADLEQDLERANENLRAVKEQADAAMVQYVASEGALRVAYEQVAEAEQRAARTDAAEAASAAIRSEMTGMRGAFSSMFAAFAKEIADGAVEREALRVAGQRWHDDLQLANVQLEQLDRRLAPVEKLLRVVEQALQFIPHQGHGDVAIDMLSAAHQEAMRR